MRSRALEEILQIMIMVGIETAQCRWFLGVLQLTPAESVFAAAPRLQGPTNTAMIIAGASVRM